MASSPAGLDLRLLRAERGEEHLFVGEADGVELGHRRHDLPHVAQVEGAVAVRAEVLLLEVVQHEDGAALVALRVRGIGRRDRIRYESECQFCQEFYYDCPLIFGKQAPLAIHSESRLVVRAWCEVSSKMKRGVRRRSLKESRDPSRRQAARAFTVLIRSPMSRAYT